MEKTQEEPQAENRSTPTPPRTSTGTSTGTRSPAPTPSVSTSNSDSYNKKENESDTKKKMTMTDEELVQGEQPPSEPRPRPMPAVAAEAPRESEALTEPQRKSRTNGLTAMPPSYTPSDSDVICAKGNNAKNHPGNRVLRSLIQSHLEEYKVLESRTDRAFIVSTIINQIRKEGGNFVRRDKGGWADVGPRNSREKIGASFRDLLHEQYSSSAKAKASRRKLQSAEAIAEHTRRARGTNSSSNSNSPITPSNAKLHNLSPADIENMKHVLPKPRNRNGTAGTAFVSQISDRIRDQFSAQLKAAAAAKISAANSIANMTSNNGTSNHDDDPRNPRRHSADLVRHHSAARIKDLVHLGMHMNRNHPSMIHPAINLHRHHHLPHPHVIRPMYPPHHLQHPGPGVHPSHVAAAVAAAAAENNARERDLEHSHSLTHGARTSSHHHDRDPQAQAQLQLEPPYNNERRVSATSSQMSDLIRAQIAIQRQEDEEAAAAAAQAAPMDAQGIDPTSTCDEQQVIELDQGDTYMEELPLQRRESSGSASVSGSQMSDLIRAQLEAQRRKEIGDASGKRADGDDDSAEEAAQRRRNQCREPEGHYTGPDNIYGGGR